MNKWLKLGTIVGAAVIGVAVLGMAILTLMPAPVSAQIGRGVWQQADRLAPPFDESGQFGPVGRRGGFRGHQGGPGGPLGGLNEASFLADALGIGVAELQTARQEAQIAAIQQAVDEGLITEAQANQMLLGGGFRGGPRGFGGEIDQEALLAETLDVSVEELEAAQQQARTAAIQQAVADGLISQAQADLMLDQVQLNETIDQDELLAGVLGISVEELQTARDEDQSLADLVDELGLDAATVRLELHNAYQAAVQESVDNGTITQDQADQILSRPGPAFGRGPAGFGGPEGPGGFGGPGHGPGGSGERGGFGGPGRGPGGFGGFGQQ